MLEREFVPVPCRVLYSSETGFAPDAPPDVLARPLVVSYAPEKPKREVVALRYAEGPRRERPAVQPRERREKPKVQAAALPPSMPENPVKVKPARIGHFPRVVGRWLLACGYRYCGAGTHVVCSEAFYIRCPRCIACQKERVNKWRKANLARVAAGHREYRRRNPKMMTEASARWQAANHDKRLAQQKRWYDGVRADPVRWAARLAKQKSRKALKRAVK